MHKENAPRCKNSIRKFHEAQVSNTKGGEIKRLMTQSLLFFLLYLPPSPSHTLLFKLYSQKGYFTKSAHIALSVIKMNCWCASVQKTNVQSQTALCPSPKGCPQSDERAYLWCVLTEFSVLTQTCNFKLEFCLTHVKTFQRISGVTGITLLSRLHQ